MVAQIHRVTVNQSHSLPARFERKFYVVPEKTGLAHGLIRQICRPDGEFPSEQINSLYFDTPGLDQHERSEAGDLHKDKVRIRWYGRDLPQTANVDIFIELKSKEAFAGTKQRRRLVVPIESLAPESLCQGIVSRHLLVETLAAFGHFPLQPLLPVIKISYWRYRYCDLITGQRVSLDCRIQSTMIMPEPGNGEKELELDGGVIEIKGRSMELPPTLMHLKMLGIDWGRFSKYSACIDSHREKAGSPGRLSPSGRIYCFV